MYFYKLVSTLNHANVAHDTSLDMPGFLARADKNMHAHNAKIDNGFLKYYKYSNAFIHLLGISTFLIESHDHLYAS